MVLTLENVWATVLSFFSSSPLYCRTLVQILGQRKCIVRRRNVLLKYQMVFYVLILILSTNVGRMVCPNNYSYVWPVKLPLKRRWASDGHQKFHHSQLIFAYFANVGDKKMWDLTRIISVSQKNICRKIINCPVGHNFT